MAPGPHSALTVAIHRSALAYRLVFDVGRDSASRWMMLLPGLLVVLVGVVIFVLFRRSPTAQSRTLPPIAGPLIALAGAVLAFQDGEQSRSVLESRRAALQSGRYLRVEGEVRDFTSEGPGRHPLESWSVGGRRYTMLPVVWASEFTTPGEIRPGMHVRIADVDGAIVRLEVAE